MDSILGDLIMSPTLIIVVVTICFQIYFFVKSIISIRRLKKTFGNSSNFITHISVVEDNNSKIKIEIKDNNAIVLKNMIDDINDYLNRNYNSNRSSINFDIIKDIIERSTDKEEENIIHRNPIPIYLGLLCTMIGVAIGMFGLSHISPSFFDPLYSNGDAVVQANGVASQLGVAPLLNGIKIAMIASATGVFLTILNIVYFTKSKTQFNNKKHKFYSFLQTELLPSIKPNINKEIESLKYEIGIINKNFGNFTSALNTFTDTFQKSFVETGENFNKNIQQTLKEQKEILEKIGSPEFTRRIGDILIVIKSSYTNAERFIEGVNKCNKLIEQLPSLINKMSDIDNFLEAIVLNVAVAKKITSNEKEITELIKDGYAKWNDSITIASKNLEELVLEGANKWGDSILEWNKTIANTNKRLEEAMNLWVDAFKNVIPDHIGNNKASVLGLIQKFDDSIGELKIILEQHAKSNSSEITKSFTNSLNDIQTSINDFTKKIKEQIEKNLKESTVFNPLITQLTTTQESFDNWQKNQDELQNELLIEIKNENAILNNLLEKLSNISQIKQLPFVNQKTNLNIQPNISQKKNEESKTSVKKMSEIKNIDESSNVSKEVELSSTVKQPVKNISINTTDDVNNKSNNIVPNTSEVDNINNVSNSSQEENTATINKFVDKNALANTIEKKILNKNTESNNIKLLKKKNIFIRFFNKIFSKKSNNF